MSGALDRLVPRIKTLVDRVGKTVTFKIPASESYDPTTLAVTETSVSDVAAVVTPPESYSSHFIDGDVIRIGDMHFSLPASGLTFTPAEGQRVVIGSDTWHVVQVVAEYTGELVGYYDIQVRK